MEYQKIINFLIHQTNHLNLSQKNWVKINDESRGTYNKDNQIRFKTSVLRSSLCGYSDYIYLLKEL